MGVVASKGSRHNYWFLPFNYTLTGSHNQTLALFSLLTAIITYDITIQVNPDYKMQGYPSASFVCLFNCPTVRDSDA